MEKTILISLALDDLKSIISDGVKGAFLELKPDSSTQEISDDLIKIEDVCRLLGVLKVTVHAWKKKGFIPFHRISNKVYFRKKEVLSSLRSISSSHELKD